MRLLKAKKKLASMIQVKKKSQRAEDFIKKCNHKTLINSTPKRVITSLSI